MTSTDRPQAANTIAMLGQAYSLLGFKIVDGVVGAGYPQKPSHSAVFAQIKREGSRLTDLAKGANMTPQSMSELVAELVELGYVERKPDPTDGRAKLIVLTDRGNACIDAAQTTIQSLEDQLTAILGDRGHRQLRTLLTKLLAEG
ncbi:MarR family winged helix-turn-helix transcriptional regulator [Kribbella qitaiheensis]|uniref:MarR family winged helix-turn-helix transcriptional regulator n=1 Tax=Kribbella qitaiheensis TaxID=1544730 RepID=UPI00361A592E